MIVTVLVVIVWLGMCLMMDIPYYWAVPISAAMAIIGCLASEDGEP